MLPSGDQILAVRSPSERGYADCGPVRRGGRVQVEALPGITVDGTDILGPAVV
jgi:hypothetical protein